MERLTARMKRDCCFIPRFVLKCLGLNLEEVDGKFYKLYSSLMLSVAATYPFISAHMVFSSLDNFDALINGLCIWSASIAGALKVLIILYYRSSLDKIVTRVEDIQGTYNNQIWSQNQVYEINKKIFTCVVVFYLLVFGFCGSTLLERILVTDSKRWRTPFADITVINITYSPNFEIAWIYQSLATIMVSSTIIVPDFLVAAIMLDLTVQFKILKCTLQKIFNAVVDGNQKDGTTHINCSQREQLQHAVKYVVEYHLSIIDLANDSNSICSKIVFVDVIGNVCIICFSVYYGSALPLFDVKGLQSYYEMVTIIVTLVVMSYCGSELSSASENITTACYNTKFVGPDVTFQKDLILTMLRSQKPIKITVGPFTDLTIPFFVWILRSSYSYLMFLRKSRQT